MFLLSHFAKQRQNNYLEIILPRGGVTTLQFCGEFISTECQQIAPIFWNRFQPIFDHFGD